MSNSLNPNYSLSVEMFGKSTSNSQVKRLLQTETRWHYSTQYLSELRGEEILENILSYAHGPASRAMLQTQLKDELLHTRMFKQIINALGLDARASRYADGYVDLVMSQSTLSEKVFVFQILTEAVSSGYCEWRKAAFAHPELNIVDHFVFNDEVRHLKMGHSLLQSCDPDEISGVLTRPRMKQLFRSMNSICKVGIKDDLPAALLQDAGVLPTQKAIKTSRLDQLISRSVMREFMTMASKNDQASKTASMPPSNQIQKGT